MSKDKWYPCLCTILLGIAVIVFTWWSPSWARIALTIVGGLIILRGLINKCCFYCSCKKEEGTAE